MMRLSVQCDWVTDYSTLRRDGQVVVSPQTGLKSWDGDEQRPSHGPGGRTSKVLNMPTIADRLHR